MDMNGESMMSFKMIGRILSLSAVILLTGFCCSGHWTPNSILLLHIKPNGIEAEFQLPLKELQFTLTEKSTGNIQFLTEQKRNELADYIIAHTRPVSPDGSKWTVTVRDMSIATAVQTITLPYQELRVTLWLEAPKNESPRKLSLYYDGIIHQELSHRVIVFTGQDWEGGKIDSSPTDVGVIEYDQQNSIVPPLTIDAGEGSNWRGFKSMVNLGMHHISEGTDHLLFLFVLLLPATLLARNRRWSEFGGVRFSVVHLLKIITSFTIGHSISLLFGAMGWLVLPSQPIETAIAFTILITAVHSIYPIFPGKEILIALVFGAIHGLAFATALSELDLNTGKMILSILGFNVGIEFMQVFFILCTIPLIIIMSKSPFYKWFRIVGGVVAIIASIAWAVERITLRSNLISDKIEKLADNVVWFLLGLILLTGLTWGYSRFQEKLTSKR
jgi:hypothetical protein